MPSGGKGSSPAGQTTTTSVNPTQQAQLPYLEGGWSAARDLYQNSPYSYNPYQTLATPNYWLPTGYNELAASGAAANNMLPGISDSYANFSPSIYNSPSFSGLSDIASGTNAYLGQAAANVGALSGVGNAAMMNPYAGLLQSIQQQAAGPDYGRDQLQNTASGMYLNSNPYIDEMYGAASDAVTRAYQTATAPETTSNFATAGRYGSGVLANARGQNEQNLGSSLGNLSANIYGGNYQAERARQDAASQALSSLIAQNYALQGNLGNAAGNQYLQGLQQAGTAYAQGGALDLQSLQAQQAALSAMQSGYQTGNQQQLQGFALAPSIIQSMFAPSQAMIQAGQGLTGLDQSVLSDQEKRFYGQQQAPWTNLQQYMSAVGQPTTGSGSVTQPYFQNQIANLLGGATGALGLYNGLSSAFGGAAGGAPAGWLAGSGAGSGIFTNAATGITSDIAGSGFPGLGLASGIGGLFSKFSDRRLKRDMDNIGTLPNGLSIYSFRYLWDDEPQIGLMADEVEIVHPEAVMTGPFGFKMVNYELAVI